MIHLLHMVMTPDLAGKMPGQHVNETTVTRQIILCTASCSFGMRKWETLPAYRI